MDPDIIYVALLVAITLIGGIPLLLRRRHGSPQYRPQPHMASVRRADPPEPPTDRPWWERPDVILAIITLITLIVNTWQGRVTALVTDDNQNRIETVRLQAEEAAIGIEKVRSEVRDTRFEMMQAFPKMELPEQP
jgi:hypothetical protein